MTEDEMPKPFGRGVNGRMVAMLAGLVVVIAASVIATDALSPRNRGAGASGGGGSGGAATSRALK